MTVGHALLKLLDHYGVDTLFGLPGVHTVELYRAMPDFNFSHYTPRHEQGAGFMADGYARSSGRPGVCFLITGPGLTNALTAIAQAYADSVPMLVVSAVNPILPDSRGEGRLHELPDQQGLMDKVTAFSETIAHPSQLAPAIARAFAIFDSARPRPVHIEIPMDVFAQDMADCEAAPAPFVTPQASDGDIEKAAQLLANARRPVVIAGGGARFAGNELRTLCELLDAPFHHTIAAKGVVRCDHKLNVGCVLGSDEAREQVRDADVLLVAGSELAATDLYPHHDLPISSSLIRVDIDARQLSFAPIAEIALQADAKAALGALVDAVGEKQIHTRDASGFERAAVVRDAVKFDVHFQRWLDAIRNVLPDDAIITADSTQIVYVGNASFPMNVPSSWLTSVTGYGTLGYALPAAIGACIAHPGRRVVCIAGDGGFQFTSAELMTAAQVGVSLDIVIWNNSGYGEIRDSMNRAGVAPEGVDVGAPDFMLMAQSCGVNGFQIDDSAALEKILKSKPVGTRVIELRVPT